MRKTWNLTGEKALRMAVAKLTGAVWRTFEQPEAVARVELLDIAQDTAGEQAAQALADSADYYREQLEHDPIQLKDPARMIERLDRLAAELAGHPVTPSPREPYQGINH